MLGVDCSMPLFVSPAAMAKLIHPDGECAIAKACETKGIMQGVCIVVCGICIVSAHVCEALANAMCVD